MASVTLESRWNDLKQQRIDKKCLDFITKDDVKDIDDDILVLEGKINELKQQIVNLKCKKNDKYMDYLISKKDMIISNNEKPNEPYIVIDRSGHIWNSVTGFENYYHGLWTAHNAKSGIYLKRLIKVDSPMTYHGCDIRNYYYNGELIYSDDRA